LIIPAPPSTRSGALVHIAGVSRREYPLVKNVARIGDSGTFFGENSSDLARDGFPEVQPKSAWGFRLAFPAEEIPCSESSTPSTARAGFDRWYRGEPECNQRVACECTIVMELRSRIMDYLGHIDRRLTIASGEKAPPVWPVRGSVFC